MTGILKGKVALVTGAGTGLGRGIAQALAEAGADIAVAEINAESAEVAAGELAELGVRARAYPTDVSKSDQVDRAFTSCVSDLGRLDVVVNNAGISRIGPHTQDVSDEDWMESIAVMQTGVFFCMRAAGRIMIPQGSGSVINISSIRGYSPNPGRMTYCSPKAAVIMMTKIAAGEWAEHGVQRVTPSRRECCERRCGTPTSPAAPSTSRSTSIWCRPSGWACRPRWVGWRSTWPPTSPPT